MFFAIQMYYEYLHISFILQLHNTGVIMFIIDSYADNNQYAFLGGGIFKPRI